VFEHSSRIRVYLELSLPQCTKDFALPREGTLECVLQYLRAEYLPLRYVSISAKQKPALDESSFQQLLAAAYVVQEHNDSLRAEIPRLDTAEVLAEMAEIQSLVLAGEFNLGAAAKLITDRTLKITAAAGVSISVVSDGYLDCVAESGMPAAVPGSSLASHSLVATERLKAGEIFASDEAQKDIRMDGPLCVRLGVGSLVAAPLFRFGEIAGLIEARWGWANGFRDSDVAACKLMAGLTTGMLERQSLPAKVANDPPQQASTAVAEASDDPTTVSKRSAAGPSTEVAETQEVADIPDSATVSSQDTTNTLAQSCRVCGRPFGADEAFCGHCSMPRAAAVPSNELQSKWASLWYIQRAQDTLQEREQRPTSIPVEAPRIVDAEPPALLDSAPGSLSTATLPDNSQFSYFEPTATERGTGLQIENFDYVSHWSRVVRALRDRLRVKDVLLIAIAATLAFGVVSAWPSSGGQLTWFQSMLVRLGWAQTTPHAPTYTGNPQINVWIDEQNALYYCEGSDLYGKTPEGRFVTQREAQVQHFEPAAGLACQ
jgi:hypothetical protein